MDDSQLMGEKRVELTELSPTHRPRTRTMPEKVKRAYHYNVHYYKNTHTRTHRSLEGCWSPHKGPPPSHHKRSQSQPTTHCHHFPPNPSRPTMFTCHSSSNRLAPAQLEGVRVCPLNGRKPLTLLQQQQQQQQQQQHQHQQQQEKVLVLRL